MLRRLSLITAMVTALALPATDALAWVARGRGGHVYAGRGVHGAYVGRGVHGAYVRRGVYGGGGRYWHGRYWGYGVGPCWRVAPYGGWVWACY
jgi:hypothetical protein